MISKFLGIEKINNRYIYNYKNYTLSTSRLEPVIGYIVGIPTIFFVCCITVIVCALSDEWPIDGIVPIALSSVTLIMTIIICVQVKGIVQTQ